MAIWQVPQSGQSPAPGVSGDATNALADALGITPAELAALGPGSQVASDPIVFMGRTPMGGTADHPNTGPADQTMPRSRAYGDIYGWSPDRLRSFQDSLIAAGLVDPTKIRRGVRDTMTVNVWQDLVDQSAQAYLSDVHLSPTDLLAEYAKQPIDPLAQPEVVRLSNPDDIKAGLRETFKAKLGAGKQVDENQLNAIVAAYQSQEKTFADQAHSAQAHGGTVTDAPSLKTFADTQAKKIDPTAYDAYGVLDKFSVLAREFGGGN